MNFYFRTRAPQKQQQNYRDTTTSSGDMARIICPQERYEQNKGGKVITISEDTYQIIYSSYLISDVEKEKSNHRHSMLLRNKKEGDKYYFMCPACQKSIIDKTYYLCIYCNAYYHKECTESPSLLHSSDHPKHPLQLIWASINRSLRRQCFSCREHVGQLFCYCSFCDFLIHHICARNPTSLTIENRKRHEHTLHYFPRKSTLVCDVCGLEDDSDYLYVCLLCDFIVHKRCINLPYVIKVSRHNHRLAFTPNLPSNEWTDCGVCHAKINENYGEYSCTKGCVYAVHSRCAMQYDVSDGKELEDEPEEEYENTKMFEEVSDGIIQHLSHPNHQMRLDKMVRKVYEENKHCQACRLPSYDDGNVYRCMQCDFILHESCAYIPRVKHFMLHIHPLVLKFDYTRAGWFTCRKCLRESSGFSYVCLREGCSMKLDTLCASICESFDYHSHPHPLFITCGERTHKMCSICQSVKQQPLNCVKCDFVLCFHCATLPQKVRYKHDEHLLIFSYKKDANDELYSCEICEEDINPKTGLYACNECQVTLHINCLLGRDPYIKSGHSMSYASIWMKTKVYVAPNTFSTRPICKTCLRHCSYKLMIKTCFGELFCSLYCCQRHCGVKEPMMLQN